jgi:hypothetical protein
MRFAILLLSFFAATSAAPSDVEIVGMDYAFKVPSELPAGRTVFRFRNAGKQRHEFNITLLKPGVTPQQFMAAANASKPVADMVEASVGVLFAKPGQRSEPGLSTNLLAGRTYVIRCIFRDTATAPRHQEMGMYSTFRVTNAKGAATSALPIDTIGGNDYAFKYARTLAPGVHRFAFVNNGKMAHEFAIQLLKRGVTLEQVMKADAKDEDVEPFFDKDFGLLYAPPGKQPTGVLEIDLLPGRDYLIECGLSDNDKAKPHYLLGMTGAIRVLRR